MPSTLSGQVQSLLDDAVQRGVAPGLVAVAFGRDGELASGAAGVRCVDTQEPMSLDSVLWLASMSKAVASTAALSICDRTAFDLDSHEALVEILPELELGGGKQADLVFDGKDADGRWRTRQSKVGVTLRHLLLHASGFSYDFLSEPTAAQYAPTGNLRPMTEGDIASFDIPRLFDAGTAWTYGCSTDWVGLFIVRKSGLTLREAFKRLVFEPLGVPLDDLDTFRSPEMDSRKSSLHAQIGPGKFVKIPFDTPQFESTPPEGRATFATASLWGTIPAYAAFARALLGGLITISGKPLLSPSLLAEATADGLAALGLSLPNPVLETVAPRVCNHLQVFSRAKGDGSAGEGWTLFQTVYTRDESETGRQPGTHSWAGLSNSYFFVDAQSGVGGVIGAAFFPFADKGVMEVRDELEKLIYQSLAKA